jgi:hypothetical protein
MSTETTKAMQEALQAAVARMNTGNGSGESRGGPGDLLTAVMPLLPKLLQNNGVGEELLERFDTLQKADLAALREQVHGLRKQGARMLKAQEHLLETVQDIQRQQVAVAGAVLDLAQQIARITFIDDPDVGDEEDAREPPAPAFDYRTSSAARRNGNGRRQHET